MYANVCVLVALVLTCCNVESYRILGIFPHTAKSHDYVFDALMKGLAKKGHEVTVISHFPNKNPQDRYTHINLRGSLPILEDVFTFEMMRQPPMIFGLDQIEMHYETIMVLSELGKDTCHAMLQNEEVKKLKHGQFDLAIVETFNSDCNLGLVDHLKVPFIGFSSHAFMPWTIRRLGLSDNPSFKPFHFLGYGRQPNFVERIKSFIANQIYTFIYYNTLQKNDIAYLENYYNKDFSNIDELAKSMSLVLVSTYFPLHGAFEAPPSVIEVGGIHIQQNKTLPKDLQKYMDEAKHGVIVFSMGSMLRATSWPPARLKAFQEAFSSLPQNILWKWEDDAMPGKPANVKIVKWLPQYDLLNHPNIKALITHAGGLGLSEAVHCGVPVLAIPIYGDQAHNAGAARDSMIGEVLEYDDITTENVLKGLTNILEPKIQQNSKRLSAIWRDRQNSPMDTGIYWVEYVIKHGGKHLRPASADLPLYRYLLLDIIAFFIFLGLIFIMFIRWTFGKLCSSTKKNKKDGIKFKKVD